MQPFAEFRAWTRRASTAEKAQTAIAVTAVLAALSWLLVPTGAASPGQNLGSVDGGTRGGSPVAGSGVIGAPAAPVAQPGAVPDR